MSGAGRFVLRRRNQPAHIFGHALSAVSTVTLPGALLRKACDRDPAMGYLLMKRLLEVLSERLDVTLLRAVSPTEYIRRPYVSRRTYW